MVVCSLSAFSQISVSGCAPKESQKQTVFGGAGADVQGPDSKPLGEVDDRPRMIGPCADAPPPGEEAILDDFEDGDHQLFKTYHREGWWFAADDGSEGSSASPFKAESLPEGQATSQNEMAVHLKAEGMNDWGVSWGTTLRWKKDGLSCPFNASHFEGIRFRAKGPATIKLKINTVETTPAENGGICREKCWDSHAKVIRIKEEWTEFFVRFDELQQEGWGTDSKFDSTRLLALNFTAGPGMLPVDFWLDDVSFIQKGEKPAETSSLAPEDESAPPPDVGAASLGRK